MCIRLSLHPALEEIAGQDTCSKMSRGSLYDPKVCGISARLKADSIGPKGKAVRAAVEVNPLEEQEKHQVVPCLEVMRESCKQESIQGS